DRATDCAAWRNACVARLTTLRTRERNILPPEMSVCGASPSQEQKCLTVAKRLTSVLISEIIVCTVAADKPVIATKSTPTMRANCARALKFGWFLDLECGLARGRLGSGASGSPRDPIALSVCSICVSQTAICTV